MDNALCFILTMALIGWFIVQTTKGFGGDYRRGKRDGSKKGYHAGYQQATKDSKGCGLSFLLIFAIGLSVSVVGCGPDEKRNNGSATNGESDPVTMPASDNEVSNAAASVSPKPESQAATPLDRTQRNVSQPVQAEPRSGGTRKRTRSLSGTMRKYAATSMNQLLKRAHEGDIDLDLSGNWEYWSPVYIVPEPEEDQPLQVKFKAVVPLRIFKAITIFDERRIGLSGAATSLSVCRAKLHTTAWVLTENERLSMHMSGTALRVAESVGGEVYLSESEHSEIFLTGDFDVEIASSGGYSARIVLTDLRYAPEPEGYYHLDSLRDKEWDSDSVLNWNHSGVLTGSTPKYFEPESPQIQMRAQARLIAFELEGPQDKVLARYRIEDAERERPDQSANR